MEPQYIFAIATVFAVIPIAIVFKIFIERLRNNPDNLQKIMMHYFISIAIIEVIPIVLIIFGFIHLAPVSDISELYVPGSIVLLTTGFGVVFILMQGAVDLEVDTQMFRMISISLIMSIPILTFVAFATMLS